MIQQTHLAPWPTFERTGKDQVTQPGMAVSIGEAVANMDLGSPEEQAGAFYEKMGMPIPDFDKMTKTDRMIALNKYRKEVSELEGQLNEIDALSKRKHDEAILQKTIKAKVDEQTRPKQGTAPGDSKGES